MNVLSIQEIGEDGVLTIGIASNVKKAEKLIEEYYGNDMIEEIEFIDIRDSSLEYSKKFRVKGIDGEYVVQVILEWFELDSL